MSAPTIATVAGLLALCLAVALFVYAHVLEDRERLRLRNARAVEDAQQMEHRLNRGGRRP